MAQESERPIQSVAESDLHFGPFRLEMHKRLWHGEHLVALRPRALAVLRYLAERPGQLVTTEELLKHLWPRLSSQRRCCGSVCTRFGTPCRIAQSPHGLSRRLADRGIGSSARLALPRQPTAPAARCQGALCFPRARHPAHTTPYTPLRRTRAGTGSSAQAFARAQQGERQVVFLAGEPGIGKTTLVDRFLAQVQASGPVWIGRGQCLELHGPGGSVFTLLEALGQLCQEARGAHVLAILRRYAPLWLVQMAGLLEAHERDALQRQVQGSGQERMVREFAEAAEMLAADAGLILVCEDLQWSDVSTVEALAYLAQRRRNARLHILGTYRPADVVVRQHPLRRVVQELYGHGRCEELALELFTEAEVEAYLGQRFGQSPAVTAFSQTLHRSTDGNALFIVNPVDYLCQQGLLVDAGGGVELRVERAALTRLVPDTLQQLITRQCEALSPEEQQLLRAASVAGMTFTAAEVAGVVGHALEDVEAVYDTLASREHFIAAEGMTEWPDGTVTGQYGFRHALYQQVLYEQVGQARRVRLHWQLGARKEAGYGDQTRTIAGELVVHFTQGRDASRAALYHGQAGENAFHRSAYREAIDHCQEGLALLAQVPDTPARQRQELALRMIFAGAVSVTQGFSAAALVQNLSCAQVLCQALHDDATLVSVLVALGRFYDLRADRDTIEQQTDEKLRLLGRVQEPTLALQLHTHLGTSYLSRDAQAAQAHHAQALELYDPQQHRELALRFSVDPAVVAGVPFRWSLWLAGWPDRARPAAARPQPGQGAGSPLLALPGLRACGRGPPVVWCPGEVERLVEEGGSLAREHGVALFSVHGGILQAYVRVQRGESEAGLSLLTEGVAQYRGLGAPSALPSHLCFVADVYRQLGRVEEGLATVAEAVRLTETHADVWWAAEVYRLQGELLLTPTGQATTSRRVGHSQSSAGRDTSAVASSGPRISVPRWKRRSVCTKLGIARQQEAKSLELRADEFEPAVACPREENSSPAAAGGGLRLVHGGI